MTLEHLQSLSNEELNELAAVKVMGWEPNDKEYVEWYISPERKIGYFEWRPTDDMNDCWEMIGKVKGMLFSRRRSFLEKLQRVVSNGKVESGIVIAWPDVMFHMTPRDITIAAILAKGE